MKRKWEERRGVATVPDRYYAPLMLLVFVAVITVTILGVRSQAASEVVVYTALDSEFSQPIFEKFTAETGIVVRPKFDVESTKTVGLVEAIIAERERPRCDVFWNNEILHTLRLQRLGLLDTYFSPMAQSYPAPYVSQDGRWYGFAARARVLLVNTKVVANADHPKSIYDLGNERWRGRAGIAKPLFGTTATHAACLFEHLGDEKARAFFAELKNNEVQILAGNKQVAVSVAAGQLAFGLTDTDDAIVEIDKGSAVAIVYPDQHDGGMGTLFIPNTLSLIKGAPHSAAAQQLIDYLLSPPVEMALANGPSAQIPLNTEVKTESRVKTPRQVRPMQVDFHRAAEQWERAARFIRDEFVAE